MYFNSLPFDKIRLAYDISPLGIYFSRSDAKTGIYRVAEEVLNRIAVNKNIDITLVGMCSEATAFTAIGSQEYFNFRSKESLFNNVNYQSTFRSRFHLGQFYKILYGRYFSKDFQRKRKTSLDSILIRGTLKILEFSNFSELDTFKVFDSERFDLFHSTYYALPSKELTKNLPRLLTVYDLIPIVTQKFVPQRLSNYFAKILASIDFQTDWVTCISEYTRQEFCEYTGFPYERTCVTYLAADEIFQPVTNQTQIRNIKAKYYIPESNYFLCLASHLDPRKNIFHLVKTFVRLVRANPQLDANLVLIGTLRFKRDDVTRVFQEFDEYKHRIVFTGYVPDEDLSSLYSGATAFVFPSLYEGFGLPILEAMQTGTPVISSNATSLPEVAGNAALLVDPKDEDSLCQAMLDVLQDSSLQQQLRAKGLEQAKKFSWQKCADQTVEIYKQILGAK